MDQKEMWIEAHEELVGEYLEAHPTATEDEAYEKTEPMVEARFLDNFSSMVDFAHDAAKDRGL